MLTVGHSNHSLETFLRLLSGHGVRTVVDVRSFPSSRHVPHFAAAPLRRALAGAGIAYHYLGRELGGRPLGSEFYDRGRLIYSRRASALAFRRGIDRLLALPDEQRLALLCSEENPFVCHRRLLVGAALAERGVNLHHIRGDGSLVLDLALPTARFGQRSSQGGVQEASYAADECVCGAWTLFTIGFAGRTAESFFEALQAHGVRRVLDVRLRNTGQLAGFAKRRDLQFFLQRLHQIEYVEERSLAPTSELIKTYRATKSWPEYEHHFLRLLREREVTTRLDKRSFRVPTALLCSERDALYCHRRLVAEHLQRSWGALQIVHI